MFKIKNRKNHESVTDTGQDARPFKKTGGKRKKRLIIISVLAALLLAGSFIGRLLSGGMMPAEVTVGTAETMDLAQTVTVAGVISGSQSAEVVSSLGFEIISILVEEGDIVKKDQVLAMLDGEELQYEYQKAAKALEEAKYKFESSLLLYEEGAISKSEYISSKNAYESSQITFNSFNIGEKTKIRSPISGTVTRVNANLGRYANNTEDRKPMFIIEDLENLKMDVQINEYDIKNVKLDQLVTITADALGKESIEGKVSRISPTGELKDPASKEMVIPVQISIEKNDCGLIAGVTAKAKILIDSKTAVMTVPIDSVLEDPDTGESYIFVVEENIAKKVIIEPGIEGDFYIEVLNSGLSDGDQVILGPTFDLNDGTEVLVLSL